LLALAELRKNYPTDFHKFRWNGGAQATKETIGFCGNPDHVRVRVRVRLQLVKNCQGPRETHKVLRMGRCVLAGVERERERVPEGWSKTF